jgi:hypothetical protein
LQDLDFTLDLFLLDGFQDFDNAFFIVQSVDSLKDFRVLAAGAIKVNVLSARVSMTIADGVLWEVPWSRAVDGSGCGASFERLKPD